MYIWDLPEVQVSTTEAMLYARLVYLQDPQHMPSDQLISIEGHMQKV